MTLPSVLLVPGAWHHPDHYRLLVDEFAGVDVHTVTLSSNGTDPTSLGDMYTDAEIIEAAAAAIDGPVVVVAHSYGGVPATQGLSKADNVQRIVYLCSFQLDEGESLFSSGMGNSIETWGKVHEVDGVPRHVEHRFPLEAFYLDVPSQLAEEAIATLTYHSYVAPSQPLTQVAWKTIPSTYIICEADNALVLAQQEQFAKRANRIRRMNASHSPFLSQPAALAQILREELEA